MSVEFFLLERYYLFSKRNDSGPLLRVQVKHQPYKFRAAVVDEWSTLPIQQDGFQDIHGAPAHACVVDGFDVQVFGSERFAEATHFPPRSVGLVYRLKPVWSTARRSIGSIRFRVDPFIKRGIAICRP